MAERLTKKISKTIQNKYSLGSYLYYDFSEIDDTNKLLNKLGKLEDILEKYDIEGVEELDKQLANGVTWQKACELACKWFKQTGFIGDQTEVDYYYQQAKTEGNDE